MDKKAWIVSDRHEGYSTIIFHNHGMAARRIGAEEMGLGFEDVSCSRCQKMDKYSKKGLPVEDLINEFGWWYECYNCGKYIDEDNSDNAIFKSKDIVFCSVKCEKYHYDKIDRINSEYEQFQIAILNLGFKENIIGFNGGYPYLSPVAFWNFPGAKYLGSLHIDRKRKELIMYCANGDRQAYYEWKKLLPVPALDHKGQI